MKCDCFHSSRLKIIFEENSKEEVFNALKNAFQNTPQFHLEFDSNPILKGNYTTKKCGWIDAMEIKVVENQTGCIVYAYSYSTNCCPNWCGSVTRLLFNWLVCYGDNGQNKKHIKEIMQATSFRHKYEPISRSEFPKINNTN